MVQDCKVLLVFAVLAIGATSLVLSERHGELPSHLSIVKRDVASGSARSRFLLPRVFDFERFQKFFNKHYSSFAEKAVRAKLYLGRAFRSFVSAVSYKHSKVSFYLGINHMSDWTPAEVRNIDVAPDALVEMLDPTHLDTPTEIEEPIPAASLDEVESALGEIVSRGSDEPTMRMIAEEIDGSVASRRRRRAAGASGVKRELSVDDLLRDKPLAIDESSELGQHVESNNPSYQAPEVTSFGLTDDTPRSPLAWRDSNLIINLPGKEFLDTVLQSAANALWKNKEDETTGLPDEIFTDHRGECMFTPRNQGKCGCCYAFAAITIYEWLYCKATGKKVAFSEQYIVDCGGRPALDGCSGGFLSKVPEFIRRNGLELRANYPYRDREDQCPYDDSTPENARGYLRFSIQLLKGVSEPDFEDTLKTSPMVVPLFVSDAFHEYGGGVHDGAGCDRTRGHGVVLVGSGREDNEEYWLFRNSYSASYGEGGYYKLNKKAKHCILNQQAYLYSGITGLNGEQGINNQYRSRAVKRRYHDYLLSNTMDDSESISTR